MTGYEFTRFEANFTTKLKIKNFAFDIKAVEFHIDYNSREDLRKTADYEDAKFWFIETTSSCIKEEAINWMSYYMMNAVAYGMETKNLDWRTKYLAAYDLFMSLTK